MRYLEWNGMAEGGCRRMLRLDLSLRLLGERREGGVWIVMLTLTYMKVKEGQSRGMMMRRYVSYVLGEIYGRTFATA